MLYLNENIFGNPNITRIRKKISNFIDYINSKFLEHFTPDRKISIDKSITAFKDKLVF